MQQILQLSSPCNRIPTESGNGVFAGAEFAVPENALPCTSPEQTSENYSHLSSRFLPPILKTSSKSTSRPDVLEVMHGSIKECKHIPRYIGRRFKYRNKDIVVTLYEHTSYVTTGVCCTVLVFHYT